MPTRLAAKHVQYGFSLRWLLLPVLAIVIGVAFVSTQYVVPILKSGSGYAAKNICSGYFLSGFSGELIVEQALIGASPLLANTSYEIDDAKGTVIARLYGVFPRTAMYRKGLGCTLLSDNNLDNVPGTRPNSAIDNSQPWQTGNLSEEKQARIDAAMAQAFAEPDSASPRNTKAMVVIHHGKLVAERYDEGVNPETPLIGWSMTKSITNMLLGILVRDGLLDIYEPAPVPEWQASTDDPRSKITIDQLLRMSSGLRFNEDYDLYSDVTRMLSNEPDMAHFAASMPLNDPETRPIWSYSSGTTNILARVVRTIAESRGQTFSSFMQQRLLTPLGITSALIELDASGTPVGSSYMYASARDWAKLGQLALNNGRWADQQLLPEDWITYSTTPTETNSRNNYGAHFWLNQDPDDSESDRSFPHLPPDAYAMEGYQNQYVFVIPSQDLVVVRLGFTPGNNAGVEAFIAELIATLSD